MLKHLAAPDIATYFRQRLGALRGTQVDTVCFCIHDDWGKAFYDSAYAGVEFNGDRPLRTLLDQGVDPIAETVNFCRANGMEVFGSFRMNDIHDSYDRGLGRAKRDHPEWLLGNKDTDYPKRSRQEGTWSAFDFAVPAVREYVLRLIEEAAQRWDWDGLEFDYGRNASLFREVFEGGVATEEHGRILTEFQRSLRRMTGRQVYEYDAPPDRLRRGVNVLRAIEANPSSTLTPGAVTKAELLIRFDRVSSREPGGSRA